MKRCVSFRQLRSVYLYSVWLYCFVTYIHCHFVSKGNHCILTSNCSIIMLIELEKKSYSTNRLRVHFVEASLRLAFCGCWKRGTARICCCAPCSSRSMSTTTSRRSHSSKPTAATGGGRMGQTDRQTDWRTYDSCIAPAAHATRVVLAVHTNIHSLFQQSRANIK